MLTMFYQGQYIYAPLEFCLFNFVITTSNLIWFVQICLSNLITFFICLYKKMKLKVYV